MLKLLEEITGNIRYQCKRGLSEEDSLCPGMNVNEKEQGRAYVRVCREEGNGGLM